MPQFDPLIARLYRATADVPVGVFRTWALEAVRTEIPFDGAIWGTGHVSSLHFHTRTCLQVDEALFDDLLTHKHLNPIGDFFSAGALVPGQQPPESLRAKFGQAISMADLIDDDQFYQSAVYRLCFQPRGIERILSSLHFHDRTGIYTLLSLYRFDRDYPFTPAEKSAQQQLLFHLLESERLAFDLCLKTYEPQPGEQFALVDDAGHYHQASPEFLDLLSTTDQLPFTPAEAPAELGSLRIRTERQGELWLVGLRPEQLWDQLTEREKQVVNGVASGKTFKSIGKDIQVSPSTVANHLYRVYRKLGVSSRNELLALFEQM